MISQTFFKMLLALAIPLVLAAADSKGHQYYLYVGNYTGPNNNGIQAFRYNSDALSFEPLGMVGEVKNPSFLTLHPGGRFLYAVSEVGHGTEGEAFVYAFAIDAKSGKLKFLNRQASGGAGACHLIVDKTGKFLFVANYGSGSIADFPLKADGTLGPVASKIQLEGSGPNPKRQTGPHAHAVVLSADGRFLFVPDLGADNVLIFRFDKSNGKLTANDPAFAKVKPGAGPRHFAFSPDGKFAYVLNEMGSHVTGFRFDPAKGALAEIQEISTLPTDFSGQNNSAEIEVDSTGHFLYASNRGHDSIAVFSIDHTTGKLTSIAITSTQGKTPRNFAIDPSGKNLLVANQDSNDIVAFRRDSATGKLTPANKTVETPSPVCLLFVPVA